jgi:hypothetical protein
MPSAGITTRVAPRLGDGQLVMGEPSVAKVLPQKPRHNDSRPRPIV